MGEGRRGGGEKRGRGEEGEGRRGGGEKRGRGEEGLNGT